MRAKKILIFSVIVSVLSYALSLLFLWKDPQNTFRWVMLYVFLLPPIYVTACWGQSISPYVTRLKKLIDWRMFAIIFLVVLVSRLVVLVDYPFVSKGDELREPGFRALQIVRGESKDFFTYGSYDGYGLIIPALTSLLYTFFKSSVLVYRLPAALVGIADILLFYLLVSAVTRNKIASALATLAFASMPLHLYYSRTELVVILSSLFSTMQLVGLYVLLKRKSSRIVDYMFIGTVLGLSLNLYAGGKSMAFLVCGATGLIAMYHLLVVRRLYVRFVMSIMVLLVFIVIGFGPLLYQTRLDTFISVKRLPIAQTIVEKSPNPELVKEIGQKYIKSLKVWISEPTDSWYPDHRPLFNPFLFGSMALGILSAVYKRNAFLLMALFFALMLHLSNSALTDIVNADHRLGPVYPIGHLFVGSGIAAFLTFLKHPRAKMAFAGLCLIVLSVQMAAFFLNQPANKDKTLGDYLAMHTIYFIQQHDEYYKTSNVLLYVSPTVAEQLALLHYQEQRTFMLPDISISIMSDDELRDSDARILRSTTPPIGGIKTIDCTGNNLHCPPSFVGSINLLY